MPVITETKLSADIKKGVFYPVYFFYGEEAFLTKMYADRIKTKALGEQPIDINLLEMSGNPDLSVLSEQIQAVPFFAEHKVIMINDFSIEKVADSDVEPFKEIIQNVPDTTILIFYLTNCTFSLRSEKVKKIFEAIKENACVCEFTPLNQMKIGELICKKVAKQKRVISRTTAEYLAEITACDMTMASTETAKLCSYVDEGQEITREIVDRTVAKQLETKVYTLSDAIISKNKNKAFTILGELFEQRAKAVQILSSLGDAYADYYYVKTAKEKGIIPQQVVEEFGYNKKRAFIVSKKYNESAKMDLNDIRNAIEIIFEADTKCKSINVNEKLLMEEVLLKLL